MSTTAIIAEYNPFHNGHKYQLDFAKKAGDSIIVVMSGSFVQRGDAAIFDKWTRARAALLGGADLVLELPVCFSLNTAERFAFGAVGLIDSLEIVDRLCFGSESGELPPLSSAAKIIAHEPIAVSKKLRALLSDGISYPAARSLAYSELIPSELLCKPNNILAIEYLRALINLNSRIKPVTLKRSGDYHDTAAKSGFAGASALRQMLECGKDFSAHIPENIFPLYQAADIHRTERLGTAIAAILRSVSPSELAKINDVSEGLENRLIAAARQFSDFSSIADAVKTKRYTLTRIRRILLSVLLGLDKNAANTLPDYIRVLGANEVGCTLLGQIKRAPLKIITKSADADLSPMLKKDFLATDLWALCADSEKNRFAGLDLTTSPVIIK